MKRIGKYILAASLAAVGCNAMAQGLNSGYFVEDYKFRHNMNPAFDNEQNYVSLPALGNINVRTQGNFGLGDLVFDNPRYGIDSDKKKTTFMNPTYPRRRLCLDSLRVRTASMRTLTSHCSQQDSRRSADTTPSP